MTTLTGEQLATHARPRFVPADPPTVEQRARRLRFHVDITPAGHAVAGQRTLKRAVQFGVQVFTSGSPLRLAGTHCEG